MKETITNKTFASWYKASNPFDDVVISTKVRIVRNLENFLFTRLMSESDKYSVTSLVSDCLNIDGNLKYIDYSTLTDLEKGLLKDKNILSNKECSEIIINEEEALSILTNEENHVKVTAFAPGLDCEKCMEKIYKIDDLIQDNLKIAASADFGYLTSCIKDCGSGLKISVRVFLPSITLSGNLDVIHNLLKKYKYIIKPVFAMTGTSADFSNFIFDIYSGNSMVGSELDQLATIQSLVLQIIKIERNIRQSFADNKPTVALNYFKQDFAKAMFSLLLDYDEVVSIISAVKWGLELGLITGVDESSLNTLYYKTKSNNLEYLCNNNDYNLLFEDDIKEDMTLKVCRLRAYIIKESFEGLLNETVLA